LFGWNWYGKDDGQYHYFVRSGTVVYLDWWYPTQFVNLVGGSNVRVGDDPESCTNHVRRHLFALDEYDVSLVDLPGFYGASTSNSDLLGMISEFLFNE
jgi:hypothetical protein